MSTSRQPWVPAGILAGLAGLATSYAVAMVFTIRDSPLGAVVDLAARLTPTDVAERAVKLFGHGDRTALVVIVFAVLLGWFALAGRLASHSRWKALLVWLALGAVGAAGTLDQPGAGPRDLWPVVAGLVTWVVMHLALVRLGRPRVAAAETGASRRGFLIAGGLVAVASISVAVAGRVIGNARRHVETSRRLLRIDGVTRREPPPLATLGVLGVTPWQTATENFFIVDDALASPTIEPHDWRLRIHGMVERELELTYGDLVDRELTESWITLACVTNEVVGELVANARWSGVRVADLLAEVGVRSGADCVLQTAYDGWTCATPLAALTDERDALLAVAMNGRPLPIDHGFPVRTIVPGLHGHVSATKWLVDMEVTRFARVEGSWTLRGWDEESPTVISSRIDVPAAGAEVAAGDVAVAGVAWHPATGISAVEVSVDGRAWEKTRLGHVPSVDTWVQWMLPVRVGAGEHVVRVRAIGRDGKVQTGVQREAGPDAASGWHEVSFTAVEPE